MEFIPMALMIAGTVGQTISSVRAANEQSRAAEQEAAQASQAAAIQEGQVRTENARVLARQHAIGAASGVATGSGSPLSMLLDSAHQAELDALNVRYQGALRSTSKLYEADIARRQVPGLLFGGIGGIGKSLMGDWLNRRNPTPAPSGGQPNQIFGSPSTYP